MGKLLEPSGKPDQPSCYSNLKGKCTERSCDYWHPPECAKLKTNKGCKFGETCAFLHSDNRDAPNQRTKKNRNPRKRPTNDWTYERETAHPEEEWQKISKGTSRTEIHENCRTIHRDSGTFGTVWGLTRVASELQRASARKAAWH